MTIYVGPRVYDLGDGGIVYVVYCNRSIMAYVYRLESYLPSVGPNKSSFVESIILVGLTA
jgi:hypothetical protein